MSTNDKKPAKPKTWQVPYDQEGNMLAYAPWRPEFYTWRNPEPFRATLTYEGYERGQSAAHLFFRSDEGHRYPVFLSDLDAMFHRGALQGTDTGTSVSGEWEPVKRGANYGVRLVKCDDLDRYLATKDAAYRAEVVRLATELQAQVQAPEPAWADAPQRMLAKHQEWERLGLPAVDAPQGRQDDVEGESE